MNVGMVGLGKLGGPVAYAMASRGLTVYGYDPKVSGPPKDTSHEDGLAEAIAESAGRMHFCGVEEIVSNCDVVFVAVQTPHEARFEGITPLPEVRVDFDYSYLKRAVSKLGAVAFQMNRHRDITVAVISTVLPGTMKREIESLPVAPERLVYNPSFIAMGTTIRDFLDPEFVLLGGDDDFQVQRVYQRALSRWERSPGLLREKCPQFYRTSIPNAELIKVAYNTFLGLKICYANTLMEVCHKTDCDVDEVTGALKLAHRRLISPAYLDGGMGDGGACHPRDNIALSWLARELDLSYDLFEAAMECRERQAAWLVELMEDHPLPKVILGAEYKPGSSIMTGSAALLCEKLLLRLGYTAMVYVRGAYPEPGDVPCVYLVGCKHSEYPKVEFPKGSVVIDPFRYIPDQEGVEVIRIGATDNQRSPDRDGGHRPLLRAGC